MIESNMTPATHRRPPWIFKWWLVAAWMCVGVLMAAPGPALAQDEDEVSVDARLEGYQGPMTVENDSTALIWLLFVFLGAVALGALFKDAKRTHLD